MAGEKVTRLLLEVGKLSIQEQRDFIGLVLDKYTMNQSEATILGEITNQQLLNKVKTGSLQVVHQYSKQTERPHTIYHIDDITSYVNRLQLLRKINKS